eukprot:12923185-Prorocentrum_lima.AAC.1
MIQGGSRKDACHWADLRRQHLVQSNRNEWASFKFNLRHLFNHGLGGRNLVWDQSAQAADLVGQRFRKYGNLSNNLLVKFRNVLKVIQSKQDITSYPFYQGSPYFRYLGLIGWSSPP